MVDILQLQDPINIDDNNYNKKIKASTVPSILTPSSNKHSIKMPLRVVNGIELKMRIIGKHKSDDRAKIEYCYESKMLDVLPWNISYTDIYDTYFKDTTSIIMNNKNIDHHVLQTEAHIVPMSYLSELVDYIHDGKRKQRLLNNCLKLDYLRELAYYDELRRDSNQYFIFITKINQYNQEQIYDETNILDLPKMHTIKNKFKRHITVCNTICCGYKMLDINTIKVDIRDTQYSDLFYEGIKSHIFACGLNMYSTEAFIMDQKYTYCMYDRYDFNKNIKKFIPLSYRSNLVSYPEIVYNSDKFVIFIRNISEYDDNTYDEDEDEDVDVDILTDTNMDI
jgi:hypothetical protein